MGWFIISRAIAVRSMFAFHGILAIWMLAFVSKDANNWYIVASLSGLLMETVFTIYIKHGQEWKWLCPSVLFYLLSVVPTIWMLELHELEKRIREEFIRINETKQLTLISVNGSSEEMSEILKQMKIPISLDNLSSEELVRLLEQLLLLFLIIGRWMLPKGELTHDQLSELLLVYIGTAADIVEFFDAFKEDAVRFNRPLCAVILSIWSWSLLQFTMVLTAIGKDTPSPSTLPSNGATSVQIEPCCTPEVYGIVISMFMQDAPFLVLRLLLIFKYDVFSYTNMFFTCKNTLVCMLLMYRLIVIQVERCKSIRAEKNAYENSQITNRWLQVPGNVTADQYYKYSTKVNLREPNDEPAELSVRYVIRGRLGEVDDVIFNAAALGRRELDTGPGPSTSASFVSVNVVDSPA